MDSKVVEYVRTALQASIAVLVGAWHGIPEVTQVLLWLMIADLLLSAYVLGSKGELTLRKLESGAYTKAGYLLVLALFAIVTPYAMRYAGFNPVQAVTVILLPRELASATKNLAEMGIEIPQAQQILSIFKTTDRQPTNTRTTKPQEQEQPSNQAI